MRISTTRWAWPEASPLRQSVRRLRLKYHACPVAIVWRKASAFMWATINTSPDRASVATQTTRPSASNFGANARPSSTSSIGPRRAKGERSSDKKNLVQKPKLSSAARADGPAIARQRAPRAAHYIELLRVRDGLRGALTFGGGARLFRPPLSDRSRAPW